MFRDAYYLYPGVVGGGWRIFFWGGGWSRGFSEGTAEGWSQLTDYKGRDLENWPPMSGNHRNTTAHKGGIG